MTVTRPILRWHGGKWLLAPWIIAHMPAHLVYVEPFGGAASVLLRKPKAYAEIYNDLDDDVVNLFQVMRSSDAQKLIAALRLTPFASTEFFAAYDQTSDPVERARRLVIRSFMGFGSNASHKKSGFRANSNRSGSTPAHDWVNIPDALANTVDRLRGVTITNRDALEVMGAHDGPDTLHYVDPPYHFDTRADAAGDYAHELDHDGHVKLLAFLRDLQGQVILSGYPMPLYDDALQGWTRVERASLADGAKKRPEVLWMKLHHQEFTLVGG